MVVVVVDGTGQDVEHGVDETVEAPVAGGRNGVDLQERSPVEVGAQMGAGGGQALIANVGLELEHGLLDRAVGEHSDSHGHVVGETDDLDGTHRGPLAGWGQDQRRVAREPRKEAARVVQHLLELAMGPGKELAHLLSLGGGQGARPGELIDEEAVALVGGDPTGARVRLGEIAVALEGGHLVTERRRRDTQVGGAGDVRRPDGLGGLDVLAHHGPENGGLAIVEHSEHL